MFFIRVWEFIQNIFEYLIQQFNPWDVFFAILGVVLALWYEKLGSPRLDIIAAETSDGKRQMGKRARFLKLKVTNKPRKPFLVHRQTATSCTGTIMFYTTDREKVINNPMSIKWDGTPEPIIPILKSDDTFAYLTDPRLLPGARFINIAPDDEAGFAIAVRVKGNSNAYGWTPESYSNEYWKIPKYELPPGEYIVHVRISGDNVKSIEKEFHFINPKSFKKFDLKL
jgi:hypothetical protein